MVLGTRNYGRQLRQLLPPGRILPKGGDSVLQRLLNGLGAEMERVDDRACVLLDEIDPRTTHELLVDWERLLGLPDPCAPAPTSIAERRNAIVARLVDTGGQTKAAFVALAGLFGLSAAVEEHSPWEFARSRFGGSSVLGGSEWYFVWTLHLPPLTVRRFEFGLSSLGQDRFQEVILPELLQCLVERLKPAHTAVLFAFDLGTDPADPSLLLLPVRNAAGQVVHVRVLDGAMAVRDASGQPVTVLAVDGRLQVRNAAGQLIEIPLESPNV